MTTGENVPAHPVQILYVDDDKAAGESLETALNRDTDTFDVETVTAPRDGLARLSTSEFDCLISGYDLPSMDGVTFLERVRERDPDIPFILFTASGSETIASRAISAGVTEYIRKDAEQGGIEALADRVREVTESDQTTRETEYDKANFEDFIEAFPDIVFVIDDTGRYVDLVAAGNSSLLYDNPTRRTGRPAVVRSTSRTCAVQRRPADSVSHCPRHHRAQAP